MNYLAIQTTYEQLQIGLYQEYKLLDSIYGDKKESSKYIVIHIDTLLVRNNLSLKDFSFIAVNQGPAPFTSLRVVIATVNGLSFAANIPLVGVDGLEAFVQEQTDGNLPYTVALINAYNNDVYYAIQAPNQILQKGCKNIEEFLHELKNQFNDQKIRFIGNGTALFKGLITDTFGNNEFIPDPIPEYPSLEQIALIALNQWHNKEKIFNHILPLYLKKLHYKKSISL